MADSREALLTDAQRAYLRLVHDGLTSKEIAQRLHASHHTVNAQIGVAMRVLGAASRGEAAAMLMRAEANGSYEPSYEPPAIADPSGPDTVGGEGPVAAESRGLPLPVPTAGRPLNDLTIWQRLLWIIALAAVIALAAGGLVSGIIAQLDGLARRV